MENTLSTAINYEKLLQNFCSTDELRPHFTHPNRQEGIIYATDGHQIMRIPDRLVETEYPNEFKGRFISIWPDPERFLDDPIQYDPEAIQDAILSIPRITREVMEECMDCEGDGKIYCTACRHSHECNECAGKGSIPTGKREEIADPDYGILFGGTTLINPRFLLNLLICVEATQQPLFLLTVFDEKMQLFQTGDIEVGIMLAPSPRTEACKYIEVH